MKAAPLTTPKADFIHGPMIDSGVMNPSTTPAKIRNGTIPIASGIASRAAATRALIVFVVWNGYFLIAEAVTHGQTIGKRILGLRVMDVRGFRVSWGQSVVRNLFRMVDGLPFFYLVGGTIALMERRGARLGDLAAGTVVVKIAERPAPERVLAPKDRYNMFLEDFLLTERIRRGLTTPERDLLGSLALRRERLELETRQTVFAAAAGYFQDRLELPRPEFLSPEKYVLNLAGIAYGAGEEMPVTTS